MKVLIKARPYQGEYELEPGDFSTREWGWIKRLTGYLPLTIHEGFGDPELLCVFAAIALRRAGRIDNGDVPGVYDRLIDDPAFETIDIEQPEPAEDEGDAGPPARSSSASTNTSGDGSPTNSESQATSPSPTGMPASATSPYDPPMLVT